MAFTKSDKLGLRGIAEEVIEEKLAPIHKKLDKNTEMMSEVIGELKDKRENDELLTDRVYQGHEPRIVKF